MLAELFAARRAGEVGWLDTSKRPALPPGLETSRPPGRPWPSSKWGLFAAGLGGQTVSEWAGEGGQATAGERAGLFLAPVVLGAGSPITGQAVLPVAHWLAWAGAGDEGMVLGTGEPRTSVAAAAWVDSAGVTRTCTGGLATAAGSFGNTVTGCSARQGTDTVSETGFVTSLTTWFSGRADCPRRQKACSTSLGRRRASVLKTLTRD